MPTDESYSTLGERALGDLFRQAVDTFLGYTPRRLPALDQLHRDLESAPREGSGDPEADILHAFVRAGTWASWNPGGPLLDESAPEGVRALESVANALTKPDVSALKAVHGQLGKDSLLVHELIDLAMERVEGATAAQTPAADPTPAPSREGRLSHPRGNHANGNAVRRR